MDSIPTTWIATAAVPAGAAVAWVWRRFEAERAKTDAAYKSGVDSAAAECEEARAAAESEKARADRWEKRAHRQREINIELSAAYRVATGTIDETYQPPSLEALDDEP